MSLATPTLPHPFRCSTIGAERLNGRVRDGNGCYPFAVVARDNILYPVKISLSIVVKNGLIDKVALLSFPLPLIRTFSPLFISLSPCGRGYG